ncbi:helix-turn-helix transcriptional regulator [Paenibacillus larvae]
MNISKKIKETMKEHGVTQYRLSKDTGIPYSSLSNILNNKSKNPQINIIQTIADYFGKPLDFFTDGSSLKNISYQKDIKDKHDSKKLSEENTKEVLLSEKIKAAMEQKGITRYRLSKETGITYTTLTNILNNKTKNPQVKIIQAIADYFGKPLDYFSVNSDLKSKSNIPSWATSKDKRDFRKMLEEEPAIMFDGVPIDDEDKEKIMHVVEALFWDAKKKNKRKPLKED